MNVKSLLEDRELIVLAEPTEEASSVRSRAEERRVSLLEYGTNKFCHLHDSSIDEIRDVESIFVDRSIVQVKKRTTQDKFLMEYLPYVSTSWMLVA